MSLLVGAALAAPGGPLEFAGVEARLQSASATELVIDAPESTWDLAGRAAIFAGGVVARRGALELRCQQLTVRYAADSTLQSAVADGQVIAERPPYRAGGERATLELSEGVLILEGEPWLTDGESRLGGQPGADAQIRFRLDDDRVECRDCRLVVSAERLNTPR